MKRIGIIVALRAEARCITRRYVPFNQTVALDDKILIRICGMGNEAAYTAAAELYNREAVVGLVSFGVAGALDESLQPGCLVLPETVLMSEQQYATSDEWRTRIQHYLPAHIAITHKPLITSREVLATTTAKHALATRSGGCAVDMESGAIATVAAEKNIPFITIRAIADPVEFSPPAVLMQALQPDGRIKLLPLLTLLAKRSLTLRELLQLAPGMRAACKTLQQVMQYAQYELKNPLN